MHSTSRNENIDFLRFLGLALIILAHVNPPGIVAQLRNFDVPLMVIVSALSFYISYKLGTPYFSYLWSRIKRLAFPVWIFLTFYFLVTYLISPQHPDLAPDNVLDSYLLQSGIGFVWIIRVFLLVAITAPIIFKIYKITKNKYHYFAFLFFLYILQEIALALALYFSINVDDSFLASILLYTLPYTIIFGYGLHMVNMSDSDHKRAFIFGLVVFICLFCILFMLRNGIVPTQDFKYPPQAYYLSFALLACEFVWIYSGRILNLISTTSIINIVRFIGQNSLWIYLWHIPFVKVIDTNFIVEYIITFAGAASITFLQVQLIRTHILPHVQSRKVQKILNTIFTG